MTPKKKFIVVDNEAHLDDFDHHILKVNTERDAEQFSGVVYRDTRKAIGYVPIFFYDRYGCVTGFEGWGGTEDEIAIVPASFDLSVAIVELD